MKELLTKLLIHLQTLIETHTFEHESEKDVKDKLINIQELIEGKIKFAKDEENKLNHEETTDPKNTENKRKELEQKLEAYYDGYIIAIRSTFTHLKLKQTKKGFFSSTIVVIDLPLIKTLTDIITKCDASKEEIKNRIQEPKDGENQHLKQQLIEQRFATNTMKKQIDQLNETIDGLNKTILNMTLNASRTNTTLQNDSFFAKKSVNLYQIEFFKNERIVGLAKVISPERLKLIAGLLEIAKQQDANVNLFTKIYDVIDDLLLNYDKPMNQILEQYQNFFNLASVKAITLNFREDNQDTDTISWKIEENWEDYQKQLKKAESALEKKYLEKPKLKESGYNLKAHILTVIKDVYSKTNYLISNNSAMVDAYEDLIKKAKLEAKQDLLNQPVAEPVTPVKTAPSLSNFN